MNAKSLLWQLKAGGFRLKLTNNIFVLAEVQDSVKINLIQVFLCPKCFSSKTLLRQSLGPFTRIVHLYYTVGPGAKVLVVHPNNHLGCFAETVLKTTTTTTTATDRPTPSNKQIVLAKTKTKKTIGHWIQWDFISKAKFLYWAILNFFLMQIQCCLMSFVFKILSL